MLADGSWIDGASMPDRSSMSNSVADFRRGSREIAAEA